MRKYGALRAFLMATATLCSAAVPLPAAASAQTQPRSWSIPSQDLGDALRAFALASGVDVVFDPAIVRGRRSTSLQGRHSLDDALRILLRGSGLVARRTPSGGFGVTAGSGEARTGGAAADAGRAVEPRIPSPASAEEQEIVVTGTQIRGAVPTGSSLITVGRREIERSGYSTVQEVTNSLPQNYGGAQNELTSVVGLGGRTANLTYGASVNLRGLGADATLVLLNGRRLAPAGQGTFVDVSAVPLTMVERIEIVPDGASATYGSDAVGGVVNIILRRDFEGAETSARVGFWRDGNNELPERQLSQTFGLSWRGGHALFGYEYYRREALDAQERRLTANSDLTALGGSNFSSPQGNPGTITRIGTTIVQLAIPAGQNGTTLSEGQLIAGQTNFQNLQAATDLLPSQRRHSLVASLRQRLTPSFEIFADGLFSDRHSEASDVRIGTDLLVPQTNAYRLLNNLFPGQGTVRIAYNFTRDLGPNQIVGDGRAFLGTIGAALDVGAEWRIEASATRSSLVENRTSLSQNSAALFAALASGNLATAFNPFADGSNSNVQVLRAIWQQAQTRVETSVTSGQVKADGRLFSLAGGDVRVALGGEVRGEYYDYYSQDVTGTGLVTVSSDEPSLRRTVWSVFGEAIVPLVGPANRRRGIEALELSASARYESYDDVGDSFNPRFGMRWSPLPALSVLGSYGTSFKAPFLFELASPSFGQVLAVPVTIDRAATDGSTNTLFTFGGNPELRPQRSRNWTVGLAWQPEAVPSLSIGINYFNVLFRDRITQIDSTTRVFTFPEQFGDVLIRNPTQAQVDARIAAVDEFFGLLPAPGSIEAMLDSRLGNRALVQVSGIDANLALRRPLGNGQLDLSAQATYMFEYDEQFTTVAPVARNVGTLDRPSRLRTRLGASFQKGEFALSTHLNHVGGYRNTLTSPESRIDAWTTIDAQLRYGFAPDSALGRTIVSVSVLNLFDADPPFVNNPRGWGFDPANANPLGRTIALQINHRW